MYSSNQKMSIAMVEAIEETNRRRAVQVAYNTEHGITPQTIISSIKEMAMTSKKKDTFDGSHIGNIEVYIKRLELEMDVASANLDFERAAEIRDELLSVRKKR
jgi:excinuclease ABC subunit B